MLCGTVLWAISVLFGVLLPYIFWRLSPKSGRFSRIRNDGGTSDLERHEQDSSSDHSSNSSSCIRCITALRSKLSNSNFSSIVYCVCGGVFLGVSLLDLLPDSREAVTNALNMLKVHPEYPIAEFMIGIGLLLVMLIENVMFVCLQKSNARNSNREQNQEPGHCELDSKVTVYRMFILVVTLSVHSVFEGLAIGLQDSVSTLTQLAIAIAIHKAVIAFGVGLPLFETLGVLDKLKTAVFCAMIFCAASPIGCYIGAFITEKSYEENVGSDIAKAVLQCLATGTFLYVTFMEVIPKEFSHHEHGDHVGQSHNESVHTVTGDIENHANGGIPNVTVTSVQEQPKACAQMLKFAALMFGFGIASGLGFLAG